MCSAATAVSYSRPSVRKSISRTARAYAFADILKTYSRCLCCIVGICAHGCQLLQRAPIVSGSSCGGGGVLLALSGMRCGSDLSFSHGGCV